MDKEELINSKYSKAAAGLKAILSKSEFTHEWYTYVTSLPKDLMITYLLVVLNNQVINGGFDQYFVNGYGQFAAETIDCLNEIGARKKAIALNKALSALNQEQHTPEVYRELLVSKKMSRLFEDDALYNSLLIFEREFDDNEEDIVELLGDYLSN